jgi:hypothetical protein
MVGVKICSLFHKPDQECLTASSYQLIKLPTLQSDRSQEEMNQFTLSRDVYDVV